MIRIPHPDFSTDELRHAPEARFAAAPTDGVMPEESFSAEFVVSKLKDRGTHHAFGVVTNAQDFMHILRLYAERELSAAPAARIGAIGVAS